MSASISSKQIMSSTSSQKFNIFAYWALMQYLSCFLFPSLLKKTETLNPVLLIKASAYKKVIGIIKPKFSVRIVPVDPFLMSCNEIVIDPMNTIFMCENAARNLCIKNGNWLLISLSNDDQENLAVDGCDSDVDTISYKKRWAQVCCLPCDYLRMDVFGVLDDNIVYIGPNLWFNLNNQPSPLIQPRIKLCIIRIHFDNESSPIPFATEASVSLIQSPDYKAGDSRDTLLHKYFSKQRYVQDGDIISIENSDDLDLKPSSTTCANGFIMYFRVSNVLIKSKKVECTTGFFIHEGKSSLYQVPTKFSYIPKTMDVYYGLKQMHRIWNNPLTVGYEEYIKQLQDIISPYLLHMSLSKQIPSSILLNGIEGCGKMIILHAISRMMNLHLYSIDCYDLLAETSGATAAKLKQIFVTASKYVPCLFVMKNIHVIGKSKDDNHDDERVVQSFRENFQIIMNSLSEHPMIIIGITANSDLLSSDLSSLFLHQVSINDLTEMQRKEILVGLLENKPIANDVLIHQLAKGTSGFVLSDLRALVAKSIYLANNRLLQMFTTTTFTRKINENYKEELSLSGVFVCKSDFENALAEMQAEESDFMHAPEVPNVQWDDVGGLEDVKQAILDTIKLPLEHPELLSYGLRRSGVLLFGPPGTGKTLLAKAVATECKLHFLSVKGPELLNMYVGQSEENVREVFRRARSVAPCVVFFDELDSLAPNRGRSGDSGGVMDRVVSQLLAELDGLDKSTTVYVIGATNRPDLIDPALLRPGRFDKLLFVGIAEDTLSKLKILKALTRKFNLCEDVNLEEIASILPSITTGADLYALCSDALTNSLSKCVQQMQEDPVMVIADGPLLVKMDDLKNAAENLVPSVSVEELERYKQVKIKALSS